LMHERSILVCGRVDSRNIANSRYAGVRKKAVEWLIKVFDQHSLRDEWMVGVVTLLDRLAGERGKASSATRKGARKRSQGSTPREREFTLDEQAELLAACLCVLKLSSAEAELETIGLKELIFQIAELHRGSSAMWDMIVKAEFGIYRTFNYNVALPSSADLAGRIVLDVLAAARKQDTAWLGLFTETPPAPRPELVTPVTRFSLLVSFLIELGLAHIQEAVHGQGSPCIALALVAIHLALHRFGEAPLGGIAALEAAEQATLGAEAARLLPPLTTALYAQWVSPTPGSEVVRKWQVRSERFVYKALPTASRQLPLRNGQAEPPLRTPERTPGRRTQQPTTGPPRSREPREVLSVAKTAASKAPAAGSIAAAEKKADAEAAEKKVRAAPVASNVSEPAPAVDLFSRVLAQVAPRPLPKQTERKAAVADIVPATATKVQTDSTISAVAPVLYSAEDLRAFIETAEAKLETAPTVASAPLIEESTDKCKEAVEALHEMTVPEPVEAASPEPLLEAESPEVMLWNGVQRLAPPASLKSISGANRIPAKADSKSSSDPVPATTRPSLLDKDEQAPAQPVTLPALDAPPAPPTPAAVGQAQPAAQTATSASQATSPQAKIVAPSPDKLVVQLPPSLSVLVSRSSLKRQSESMEPSSSSAPPVQKVKKGESLLMARGVFRPPLARSERVNDLVVPAGAPLVPAVGVRRVASREAPMYEEKSLPVNLLQRSRAAGKAEGSFISREANSKFQGKWTILSTSNAGKKLGEVSIAGKDSFIKLKSSLEQKCPLTIEGTGAQGKPFLVVGDEATGTWHLSPGDMSYDPKGLLHKLVWKHTRDDKATFWVRQQPLSVSEKAQPAQRARAEKRARTGDDHRELAEAFNGVIAAPAPAQKRRKLVSPGSPESMASMPSSAGRGKIAKVEPLYNDVAFQNQLFSPCQQCPQPRSKGFTTQCDCGEKLKFGEAWCNGTCDLCSVCIAEGESIGQCKRCTADGWWACKKCIGVDMVVSHTDKENVRPVAQPQAVECSRVLPEARCAMAPFGKRPKAIPSTPEPELPQDVIYY